MKQKILNIIVIFFLLFTFLYKSPIVHASDKVENDATFLKESFYLLDESESDVNTFAVGSVTLSAFLLANPTLSLGLIVLGFGGLALGLKFNTFKDVYDFGLNVRYQMTDAAYKLAVDGFKLVMTDDVKMALLRASLGISSIDKPLVFGESPGVPYFLKNSEIHKVSKINTLEGRAVRHYYVDDLLASIDSKLKYLKIDPKVPTVKIDRSALISNHVKFEFWNSRGEFPDGINFMGNGQPGANSWRRIFDYTVTNRNGMEFLFDENTSRVGYEYNNFKIYFKENFDERKMFYQNLTVTLADGSSYTYLGDTTANANAYEPIEKYVSPIYSSDTNVIINKDFAVGSTGVIDARDIPGVLGKEGGYTSGDREVISDIIVDAGLGDWEWDDKDPDTDEETDGSGLGMFDWFLRIWNFLVKMLNPIKEDVKTIGKNLNSVGDFIAKKFIALDLYLEVQFTEVANNLRALPGTIVKDMENLWADLGAVWSGIADDLIAMDKAMSDYFDNVMEGIESGVRSFNNTLADFKADVAAKAIALNDAMAKGIDDIRTDINDRVTEVSNDISDIWTWLKEFFIPDFTGIQASWLSMFEKIKLKFRPITELSTSFTGVFSKRKSIYDLEVEIFGEKLRPVPIELKSAIDVFRSFATAFLVLMTLTRIYKRFTGDDGEVIAT